MKKLLTILMIVLFTGGLMAQITKSLPTKRKCGTMENLELMKQQDPTYAAQRQAVDDFVNNYVANHPEELDKAVITVPVVVHVIWNTAAQNISDARVQEQIAVLNTDYAGLNVHSMQSFNSSLKVNTELQFCLATLDESGAATTGIERRQTSTTSFGYGTGMKYYSSGGLDQWDPNQYMNIWVCNLSGGLCGFAEFPTATLTATYGVVIHYQYFGKTGAVAPYNLGGTTTHEIGHCFNLYHIWGDDSGACSGSDYCTDTPNQADATYGPNTGVVTDACTGSSPGIMYMDFMDYSDDISYSNFTPNQKTRIQACFAVGGPLHALSLSTKCSGSTTLSANFSANVTNINVGGQVIFTSNCTGSPTSYNWTFTGGTPASATGVGPHTVTYNTAGTYNVALTVSDGSTSDTETKTGYIIVSSCGTSGYFLNFECNSDFDITFSPWTVNDVDLGTTYGIEDQAGTPYVFNHSGEAMAYLAFNPASTVPTLSADAELQPHGGARFGACMNAVTASAPNNDWLISPKVQLGTGSSLTMWVKTYTDSWGLERYKVGVSTTNNTPASFTIISTGTYESAPITWTQKTYSLASYNNQQVYVGINCVSNDAFIFMVDDINIATTLTGMNVIPEVQMINLFPNPASESAYVDITSVSTQEVTIELYDMFGKLQNAKISKEATNLRKIDLVGLAKGIYMAKIKTPLGEKIEKLVVY